MRIAAQGDPGDGRGGSWVSSSYEAAVDRTGIDASVEVAEARFNDLVSEYWGHWISQATGYETFSGLLTTLQRQVSGELASLWKGKTAELDRWHRRACRPAVEKALLALVKEWTARARTRELHDLERGETASTTTLAATSKSASEQPAGAATSGAGAKRLQLVNDFLLRCLQETQHKLLKKHIWSAVGHRSPRQFQYWQAGDDRSRGKIQRCNRSG